MNCVDNVLLEIYDGFWRTALYDLGTSEPNRYTFSLNETVSDGLYQIRLITNDTIGNEQTYTNYYLEFDSSQLAFTPELLPSGYLFNGSGLMVIANQSQLINKSIQSLHIYANSDYYNFGTYYDLNAETFTTLILDSSELGDGNHTLYFIFIIALN